MDKKKEIAWIFKIRGMSKKNKGILKFFAGLIVGIGIGLAIDNIGVGIAVGIALGAGLSQGKIAWIFLN